MPQDEAARKPSSDRESMRAILRRAMVRATVVLALVSCSEPGLSPPLEREPPMTLPPAPPLPATPAFPALTKPGEIYLSTEGPSEATSNYISRYILYEDNSFDLQYVGPGMSLSYPGRYLLFGSVIMLDWHEFNPIGNWGASGTLNGNTLVVQYNIYMQLSDFIDGTYVRVPGT